MKKYRFKNGDRDVKSLSARKKAKQFKAVKRSLKVGNVLESTAYWDISDREMGENGDKYMAILVHSTRKCHIIDLDLVDTYDEAVQSIIDWEAGYYSPPITLHYKQPFSAETEVNAA